MLRKLVRFRNFLRTWLPRRLSLVGADIQTRRVSQSPNTREPKKKFLVEDTRNLAFAEPPSRLPWSFSFLFFSYVPFLWRQTTFLGRFLFFLTSPSCGDRPALAELNGFHVRDLVCSSWEKKSFAFLTCRQKNLRRQILVVLVRLTRVSKRLEF